MATIIVYQLLTVLNILYWIAAINQNPNNSCTGENCYEPHSPFIKCSYLPLEFLNCILPDEVELNESRRAELGYGCTKVIR
uniref:Uncharacterized protein n=1 Tax=Strigamia maritima TaxID=126957 RepID=T1IIR2_STRMM